MDNSQYRLLKAVTPGPYTFILEGTRDAAARLHPKRKTIGLRVPEHAGGVGPARRSTARCSPRPDPARRGPAALRPGEIVTASASWSSWSSRPGHCGPGHHRDRPHLGRPSWFAPGAALEPARSGLESGFGPAMDSLISALAIWASRSCSRSRCTGRARLRGTPLRRPHRPPRRAHHAQPAAPHRPGGHHPCRRASSPSARSPVAGHPLRLGQPVPVNFSRLRNPKSDMLWVAAAGPRRQPRHGAPGGRRCSSIGPPASRAPTSCRCSMADAGIPINAVLMALNLLPIPPLDGGRIAVSLLPNRLAWQYARLEPTASRSCSCCCSPACSAPCCGRCSPGSACCPSSSWILMLHVR